MEFASSLTTMSATANSFAALMETENGGGGKRKRGRKKTIGKVPEQNQGGGSGNVHLSTAAIEEPGRRAEVPVASSTSTMS